jgi:hypothetical protein
MADPIAVDVAYTAGAIDRMLAAFPELAEDGDLRADMLEAETDLHALMSRLVRIRQERLATAEGLNGYIGDLTSRRDRLARGADGIKGLMLALMNSAQLPKLVLPEATISISKPRESVNITDVAALPQGTFSLTRVPDKKAIAAQIEAGDEVPGAEIKCGQPSLTIRTK